MCVFSCLHIQLDSYIHGSLYINKYVITLFPYITHLRLPVQLCLTMLFLQASITAVTCVVTIHHNTRINEYIQLSITDIPWIYVQLVDSDTIYMKCIAPYRPVVVHGISCTHSYVCIIISYMIANCCSYSLHIASYRQ